ncbi:Transcriptional regulatory protein WalR [compost metagenome]
MSMIHEDRILCDILIIEDDGDIADLISIYLRSQGLVTRTAGTLMEATELFTARTPDLVICDIMLPDGEGSDWAKATKRNSGVPIIFLSSRSEVEDILLGFELGGDDYITKPFDPDIMVARVKARLRNLPAVANHDHTKAGSNEWSDGRLTLYWDRWEVRVNGEEINLPAKELQLLFLMAGHPGKVFSVEQLYEKIWGIDGWSDTRTVMVHIHNLRRKIEGDDSPHRYIATVRGIGYKFQQRNS